MSALAQRKALSLSRLFVLQKSLRRKEQRQPVPLLTRCTEIQEIHGEFFPTAEKEWEARNLGIKIEFLALGSHTI